ncbi:serine protease ami-like [Daphnia carinata]|uniref:serine protease ami-like n=1 Tax=Daphnia carinata TaxID=120202 RepID=UPI00257D1337|nr:serine protease ami-like [Daphnia carinata]
MKLLLLLAATCTVSGIRDRITDGGLASPGQFPYVVSVTENGRHICGGFIYSARWIVTAASCVFGKSMLTLNVVVGQFNLINPDVNEKIMDVYTITVFPEYDSAIKRHDIALIRLKENILFDDGYVDFIAFNEADISKKGVIMGWGATFDGGLESVNLRYAGAAIFPTSDTVPCGNYANTEFDTTTMICSTVSLAAVPSGSACQYDEGSPFVQEFTDPADPSLVIPTAVGIFSKTEGCRSDSLGVYTRLSVYTTWLLETAGQQPTRSHNSSYF